MNFFKRTFIWLFCMALGLFGLGILLAPYIIVFGAINLTGYGMLGAAAMPGGIWQEGFPGAMSSILQILIIISAVGILIIGLVGLIREFISPVPEIKKAGVILALSYTFLNIIMMILMLVMCALSKGLFRAYAMGVGVFIAIACGLIVSILLLILIKVFGDTTVWTRRAKSVKQTVIQGSVGLPPSTSYGALPQTTYNYTTVNSNSYGIAPQAAFGALPAPMHSSYQALPPTSYDRSPSSSYGISSQSPYSKAPPQTSYGRYLPAPAKEPEKKVQRIKTQVIPDSTVSFRFIEGMSDKQIRAAVEELYARSMQGDADAQFRLGICYQSGTGVPKDIIKSGEWMQKASAQGHPQAKFVLGEYYIDGKGVPRKIVEGITLIKESAQKGFVGAQMRLGTYYEKGEYLPKDTEKAVNWYTKAAEQGNEYSIAALQAFEKGVDGKWYQK